jgi:hypothetical protein
VVKWLIVLFVALFVFSGLQRVLAKLGWGRLPGDFVITIRGRHFPIPLMSTIVLSLLFMGLSRLI